MATKVELSLMQRCKPYLCIIAGISSFGLAKWQQIRKDNKVAYLSLMQQRLSSQSIDCPTSLTDEDINNDYKFKKVRVVGTRNDAHNIYISPRKPPYSANIKNINTNDPKQLGAYIYSPVYTASGDMIICNRGWIPKEQIPSDNKQTQKETVSISYEGLITPLKNIPQFVKEAANVDINTNIWPFMDNEILKQKFNINEDMEQKELIVVDVLEPQNDIGSYPHRVREADLLYVNIPAVQHSVYVWLMCCTGIACFYYAYHFMKNPKAMHKTQQLLHKQKVTQLNAPRRKIEKPM